MDYAIFFTLLVACSAAAATGALFPTGEWYKSLRKPWWNPPNWLFPVAWMVLYLCMSAAGALAANQPGAGQAMALWAAQLGFNALWTPVFFGLRRMGAAMVIVVVLWLLVALTLIALWQVDWRAGALFVPYLGWVSVAAALNLALWRMNPDAGRMAQPAE